MKIKIILIIIIIVIVVAGVLLFYLPNPSGWSSQPDQGQDALIKAEVETAVSMLQGI